MKNKIFYITIFLLLSFNVILGASFYLEHFQYVTADVLSLDDQEATIRAINKVLPAVVSISVYGDLEVFNFNISSTTSESEKRKIELGSGTGFLISPDGLIMTNKHVVEAKQGLVNGDYRVTLNSGKKYYAQLIGKDPINDMAILKIFDKNLPFVEIGDSSKAVVGTTVIAIGNALGVYENTVTKGIVSGVSRSIIADDGIGGSEFLSNVIQTDAKINRGNSGGPLVDLNGEVIGINVAIDESGSSIGFAIPINDAKPVINSARNIGRIVRPRLGVRYVTITQAISEEKNLKRASGALIIEGPYGEPAVIADSPAGRAGLFKDDIIFEINAIEINEVNSLLAVVQRFKPGDKIGLKILRGDKIIIKVVELDEFK